MISYRPFWLLRALRITAVKDNGPFRQLIFKKLLSERPLLKLAFRALEQARPYELVAPLAVLYGVICSLRLRIPPDSALNRVFAVSGTDNEREAIHSGAGRSYPEVSITDITVERLPRLDWAALKFLPTLLIQSDVRRLIRLSRRLRHRRSVLVWLRSLAVIGFSWRFRHFFRNYPPECLMVSSESAPYNLALSPWTLSGRSQSFYFEHGLPTPVHTPLVFDRIHLWGQVSLSLYQTHAKVDGAILLHGGPVRPLVLPTPGQRIQVGIFPGLTTCWNSLHRLVTLLQNDDSIEAVLIKPHPNKYLYSASLMKPLLASSKVTLIDRTHRLAEMSPRPDLVISGNSSIHLDALREGIPSLYAEWIDEAPGDFYGFLGSKLIPNLGQGGTDLGETVRQFYSAGDWDRRRERYLAAP